MSFILNQFDGLTGRKGGSAPFSHPRMGVDANGYFMPENWGRTAPAGITQANWDRELARVSALPVYQSEPAYHQPEPAYVPDSVARPVSQPVRTRQIRHAFDVQMLAGTPMLPAAPAGWGLVRRTERTPVALPVNVPLISGWGSEPATRLRGVGEFDPGDYVLPDWAYENSPSTSGYGGAAAAYGAGAATQILTGPGSMTQRLIISAPQIVAAGISTAAALGSTWALAAAGPIGAAVAGVTIGLTLLFARKGPRQKQATTAIVDQVEPLLVENRQAYLNGPRTRSSQLQAIQNFYAGWQWVLDHCNIPEMGQPGQRCVTERQEGARPSWGPNWFELYLDPIRNDAQVKEDAVAAVEDAGAVLSNAGASISTALDIQTPAGGGITQTTVAGIPAPLLIAAGLALVFLMGGSK